MCSRQGGLVASLLSLAVVHILVIFAPTVFAGTQKELIEHAKALHLADESQWKSLLHYSQGYPHIQNEEFLLSWPRFSLESEIEQTITNLVGPDNESFACKFPARYFWLKQNLNLPSIELSSCPELSEFLEKSPVDKISLVYVSENISQPSSMMGHLFLRVSGITPAGRDVSHAISFYTKIDTLNIPKLVYQSLVSGKPGYYSLSPYKEKVDLYVGEEQRNLWELSIDASQFEKQLIAYHLFELKGKKYEYFFQAYNCATIVNFIVSLSIEELREPKGSWVTPLDAVKEAAKSTKLKGVTITPSSRWKVRMLESEISSEILNTLRHADEKQQEAFISQLDDKNRALTQNLLLAVNDFKLDEHEISEDEWSANQHILKFSNQPVYSINFDSYRSPINTPQDSQVWIGAESKLDSRGIIFGYMPASHSIEDDNRQYFGETGLNLGRIQMYYNENDQTVRLDKFQFYKAESVFNRGAFSGGLSGKIAMGAERVNEIPNESHYMYYVSGALGAAKTLVKDIDLYGQMNVGVGRASSDGFTYGGPELGAVIREVYDMKTLLSISQTIGQFSIGQPKTEINITQVKYFGSEYALILSAKRVYWQQRIDDNYSLSLKHYF